MSSSLRVLLLLFIKIVLASTTFNPECTIPPESVNIVYSSTVRGTFDILWSSIFTLLICTWTIQHLNIPGWVHEGENTLKRSLKRGWTKLKWMLITLMLPELLVARAVQDFMLARRSYEEMKEIAEEDGVGWTLTHSFYANMGGFVLRVDPSSPKSEYHLDAHGLFSARSSHAIEKLPSIAVEDIEDKSKGDFFVKGTAVVQVFWLVIQVVVRATKHLPISQLEITVLAFSVCAFITYLFSWSKPQDVMRPTYIHATKRPPQTISSGGIKNQSNTNMRGGHSWFRGMLLHTSILMPTDSSLPIPNDIEYCSENFKFLHTTPFSFIDDGIYLGGMVFGALHCFAWSFHFPTSTERMLWRVAGTATAVVPLLYPLVFQCVWLMGLKEAFRETVKSAESNVQHGTGSYRCLFTQVWNQFTLKTRIAYCLLQVITPALTVSYVLSRLFLVVEAFRSLFFLPPNAFITTWSTQIPHVS
ncbi:MAG: hypothetical protein M1840_006285 [Geoglossum simile]|nr:MAG: hypothetical protein M1840_006285 [Geoglossum simile]